MITTLDRKATATEMTKTRSAKPVSEENRRQDDHPAVQASGEGHALQSFAELAAATTLESPVVLVIDDDPSVLHLFRQSFKDGDVNVLTANSASAGLKTLAERAPDVVVLDIMLPDQSGLDIFQKINQIDAKIPVVFITAGGTSDTAIEAMKLGAYDYLLKPLSVNQIREVVSLACQIRRFMNVPVGVTETAADTSHDVLVGRCAAMQDVYKAIGRVASQNVTVLIRGESGTGKELVARAIYHHSARTAKPFLAVNCAAIPEPLLESELFGHEKGAYTGADSKRIGKFEQCSGGTLFMDEVGDMTPLVQSKVLRVLQEQRFERVGGNQTIQTDVRIIAATNNNLEQMVADGQFRADLYYRLNGFTIELPPLRERPEDVMVLLEHFLKRFVRELGKDVHTISPEALELLLHYSWPGNVRELQSVLKQALLQATGPVLVPEFLPEHVRSRGKTPAAEAAHDLHTGGWESFVSKRLQARSEDLYAEVLTLMEQFLITRVLRHTDGNQSQAAKTLGITRGCLRNKIRALGISIDQVVRVEDNPAALVSRA
jgi:two-component system nitrogen regulation response regulator GlnG